MLYPSYTRIREMAAEEGPVTLYCLAMNNPNPRFFKRQVRIFTSESPWEGDEFLERAPRLSLAKAQSIINELTRRKATMWIYLSRLPRWDPERMPWNLTHPRWRTVTEWAPTFDNDPDAIISSGER